MCTPDRRYAEAHAITSKDGSGPWLDSHAIRGGRKRAYASPHIPQASQAWPSIQARRHRDAGIAQQTAPPSSPRSLPTQLFLPCLCVCLRVISISPSVRLHHTKRQPMTWSDGGNAWCVLACQLLSKKHKDETDYWYPPLRLMFGCIVFRCDGLYE